MTIVTEENQKRVFDTRILDVKKKFTSGVFNISAISVHF
jgi:hypothetical protein